MEALLNWLAGALSVVAGWIIGIFGQILGWLVSLVLWLVGGVITLLLGVLEVLIGFLPHMPEPPAILQQALTVVGMANQILPITELLAVGTVWASFYGAMAVWRIITFLRGGR